MPEGTHDRQKDHRQTDRQTDILPVVVFWHKKKEATFCYVVVWARGPCFHEAILYVRLKGHNNHDINSDENEFADKML